MSYNVEENFFNTLFNVGEGICYGDKRAIKVYPAVEGYGEFFSINPLHLFKDFDPKENRGYPRRNDYNVTSFRNFLFEMDEVCLKDQKYILESCDIPFTTLVYSGGKSYHAILSLEVPLMAEPHSIDGVYYYKHVWKRIAAYLNKFAIDTLNMTAPESGTFLDYSCQNPSRLSRFPNGVRSNEKVQELLEVSSRISAKDFSELLQKCPEVEQVQLTEESLEKANAKTVEAFFATCPKGIKTKIKYAFMWTEAAGMHLELYKLTTWILDHVNVDRDTLYSIYGEFIFPHMLSKGYPSDKLIGGRHKAVEQAFIAKGVK